MPQSESKPEDELPTHSPVQEWSERPGITPALRSARRR
jgi:hypothetical protein